MEIQIQSTLNILRSATNDIQINMHGIRYLIDTCKDYSQEARIMELPIVETLISSLRRFSDHANIRILCCNALIVFSRFDFCIESAKVFGLIECLTEDILQEEEDKVLVMELAVMAAYGSSDILLPVIQTERLLDILLYVESKWRDNPNVIQQILSVYIIISENELFHGLLLKSLLLNDLTAVMKKYGDSHFIVFGIVSICRNLSTSSKGRTYLQKVHFFTIFSPVISLYGYDLILCRNIVIIILAMNIDKRSRPEVIHHHGIKLAVAILHCCVKDPTAISDTLKALRSICSSEHESLSVVIESNVVASIVMTLSAFPDNISICCHGFRALEWILEAGDNKIARMMIDEGAIQLCSDILRIQKDIEAIRYTCNVIGKICKKSCFISVTLNTLIATRILYEIGPSIQTCRSNESLICIYMRLLAILCSDQDSCLLILQHDIIEEVLLCANCVQLSDTAVLISGIIWKASSLKEGTQRIVKMNGIDSLLKLLQQFVNNIVIHRNCLGSFSLLLKSDISVYEMIRRRLGLIVIVDNIDSFYSNSEYCEYLLVFLLAIIKNVDCYHILLNRKIGELVIMILKKQFKHLTISTMTLMMFDNILYDDEGVYQITCQKGIISLLNEVMNTHKDAYPDIETTVNAIIAKLNALNDSL